MSVEEFRSFHTTEESDRVLEAKLQALEFSIRAVTNNNFQVRAFRTVANANTGTKKLTSASTFLFSIGDTIEISESYLNNGLYTIMDIEHDMISVDKDLYDENAVVVTKVVYPEDVKIGVVNLLKWDLEKRDKAGVASETISRHSVTYQDLTGDNSEGGYPKSLMGFLRPYKRARFGQGGRL